MWRHPNYYKNLRKLYRSRNRDQAISLQAETSDARRTPGTGQQAYGLGDPKSLSANLFVEAQEGPSRKPSSSQASSEQASAQASSGARINKR